MTETQGHAATHGHADFHLTSLWVYFGVFAALLVLTACTILVRSCRWVPGIRRWP